MKRDMDLVRQILFNIEAEQGIDSTVDVRVEGFSGDEVNYHIQLLQEAGLIVGITMTTPDRRLRVYPQRLTWQGHEFIEAARNEDRWLRTKSVMELCGGFVYDVARQVLLQLTSNTAGVTYRG